MQLPKTPLRLPSTPEILARIEAKLDRLDRVLGPLSEASAVAAVAVDSVDELARGQEAEVDARMKGAVQLLERISRPETLAMLTKAVDIAESMPGVVATAVDSVDELANVHGDDLRGRLEAGATLLNQLTLPKTSQLIEQVLGGLLEAEAAKERRLGFFGLLKALREPHTQRAVGFAVSFLESFGQALDRKRPNKSLRA